VRNVGLYLLKRKNLLAYSLQCPYWYNLAKKLGSPYSPKNVLEIKKLPDLEE
jgi:hypothetical protein